MSQEKLQSRLFGSVTLCVGNMPAIDTSGWSVPFTRRQENGQMDHRLVPDETKAYLQFKLGGSWPGRTAYGTALHPGTAANSHLTLLHQQVNDRHLLRVHSDKPQARNHFIGAVVALDYPRTPAGGWKMTADPKAAPIITAAATLFKQADEVPEILKQHLGGIHQWSVSQELYHSRRESGFVVSELNQLPPPERDLAGTRAPEDFRALNLGWVPWLEAPADLIACYDEERQMVARPWHGSQVTVLCGGINGGVHWGGAAMVPYGAEREAEVMHLLARQPEGEAEDYHHFLLEAKKTVDALAGLCSAKPVD